MAAQFCPKCGTARTGDLRFCASCAFDFGEPVDLGYQIVPRKPTEPGWAYPTPPAAVVREPRSGVQKLLIALIVLVVLGGAGYVFLQGQVSGILDRVDQAMGSSAPLQEIPPVGVIWFGATFDPETMAIRGRTTTIAVSQPFSMVTRISKTMTGPEIVLRTYLDGTFLYSQGLGDLGGSGDRWGLAPAPPYAAGVWKYELTDIGGNVLASGSVTAK